MGKSVMETGKRKSYTNSSFLSGGNSYCGVRAPAYHSGETHCLWFETNSKDHNIKNIRDMNKGVNGERHDVQFVGCIIKVLDHPHIC